jgi:hypothetical protein
MLAVVLLSLAPLAAAQEVEFNRAAFAWAADCGLFRQQRLYF